MWYGIVAAIASSFGIILGGLAAAGKVQDAEIRQAIYVDALRRFFAKYPVVPLCADGWVRVRIQDLNNLMRLTED